MAQNLILDEQEAVETQEAPVPAGSIVRIINGVQYTVLIHFNPMSKESPLDKIKRLLVNEVQNGYLLE